MHNIEFIQITGSRTHGLYGLDRHGKVWRLIYDDKGEGLYWITITTQSKPE